VGSVCYRGKNRNNNYEPLEKFYTFLGVAGVPEKIIYNFDTQYSFHVESKNIDKYSEVDVRDNPEWVHIVTQIAYRRAVSPKALIALRELEYQTYNGCNQGSSETYQIHVAFIQAYVIESRRLRKDPEITLTNTNKITFAGLPLLFPWHALWVYATMHNDESVVPVIADLVIAIGYYVMSQPAKKFRAP
jgi:hypothetical protein